jgi:hypothetical protein
MTRRTVLKGKQKSRKWIGLIEQVKREKTADTGISKNVRIYSDKDIHQTGTGKLKYYQPPS